MTNKESDKFSQALSNQQFNAHDLKVILTILEGMACTIKRTLSFFRNTIAIF